MYYVLPDAFSIFPIGAGFKTMKWTEILKCSEMCNYKKIISRYDCLPSDVTLIENVLTKQWPPDKA